MLRFFFFALHLCISFLFQNRLLIWCLYPCSAVPVDQLPRLKLVLLLALVVGTPELDSSHSFSLLEALSVFWFASFFLYFILSNSSPRRFIVHWVLPVLLVYLVYQVCYEVNTMEMKVVFLFGFIYSVLLLKDVWSLHSFLAQKINCMIMSREVQ